MSITGEGGVKDVMRLKAVASVHHALPHNHEVIQQ